MGCNTTKEVVPQPADGAEKLELTYGLTVEPSDEKSSETFPEYSAKDPDTVIAVTKIQAAYRGHRTRKEMQQEQPEQTKEELEAEFSADDKELCQAATKIQASFRGHLSRKEIKDKTDELGQEMEKLETKKDEDEELDIDLTDPELNKAATKIQASFRGHKVRKEPPLAQGNAEKTQD